MTRPNASGNWEVRSTDGGVEGYFARQEDAEHYADELRGVGARGVEVKTRKPPLGPRARGNPPGNAPPMSASARIARVREILAERGPDICWSGCPGWWIFDTDRGYEIEACDECNRLARDVGRPVIDDADAELLPEAQRELANATRQLATPRRTVRANPRRRNAGDGADWGPDGEVAYEMEVAVRDALFSATSGTDEPGVIAFREQLEKTPDSVCSSYSPAGRQLLAAANRRITVDIDPNARRVLVRVPQFWEFDDPMFRLAIRELNKNWAPPGYEWAVRRLHRKLIPPVAELWLLEISVESPPDPEDEGDD